MNNFNTILSAAICTLAMASCTVNDECRIHGTLSSDKYNGVRIFLVPTEHADSIGVDSTVIKDCHFEFVTSKRIVADIRLDYHHRFGIQNLLVVTEPGDVNVSIGEQSHSSGTAQNDSLEAWKKSTELYHRTSGSLNKAAYAARNAGDTTSYNDIKQQAKNAYNDYRMRTQQMADNVGEGPLHDFIYKMFPKK